MPAFLCMLGDVEKTDPSTWLEEHGDYLLQYAYVRLRNKAVAEDVVQETFLAGIKGLDRYNGKTPVRYWLRGILKHKIVDHIRKASREVVIDDEEGTEILDTIKFKAFGIPTRTPPPWQFDPDQAFEKGEFWDIFYNCVSKLNDSMGRAFVLRELEGIPSDEVCKELNLKPNNLWVLIHRARGQLKICLESNWSKLE